MLTETEERACSGYCCVNIQGMFLARNLECIELLECQTEKLVFIDKTPESIAVSQRGLLHEANNLHSFQQDRSGEEKYDSEAYEEKSDDGFSKGMPLRSNFSIVIINVSGVLGAGEF